MNEIKLKQAIDKVIKEITKKNQGKEFMVYPDDYPNVKRNMKEFGKTIPSQGGEVDEVTFKKALIGMLKSLSLDQLVQITDMLSKSWGVNIGVEDIDSDILHTHFDKLDSADRYQLLYDVYTILKTKKS